jgi:hypothetical protein
MEEDSIMKTKDYIAIKDNKIIMVLSTSQGMAGVTKTLAGKEYDEIQEFNGNPLNMGIHRNDDIRHFDKNWKRKTVKKLITEKLITLADDELLDEANDRIVKKPPKPVKQEPVKLTPEEEQEILIQNKMQEILRRQAMAELNIEVK